MGAFDSLALATKGYVDLVVGRTTSDITFPVDYEDVGAVDPPPGTVFYSQADLDAWLTAEGATSIKHLKAAWDSLPAVINGHQITFTCAAGVHRPQSGLTTTGWYLGDRELAGAARATISGVGASDWDDLLTYTALSVVAYTGNGSNPALQITGATFTPGELKGRFLRVDNSGQVTIIHDNTADTIYVLDNISPAATAVSVKDRPATILRNSQTDAIDAGQCTDTLYVGDYTNFDNLTVDPWNKQGGTGIVFDGLGITPFAEATHHVMLDTAAYYEITGDSATLGIYNGMLINRDVEESQFLYSFTTRPPPKSHDYNYVVMQVNSTNVGCYWYGGNFFYGYARGMSLYNDAFLQTTNTVIDSMGSNTFGSGSDAGIIRLERESRMAAPDWTEGKQFEIRNFLNPPSGDIACVSVRDALDGQLGTNFTTTVFSNNECDCIAVEENGKLGGRSGAVEGKLLNGAVANQGWGIRARGPRASIYLGVSTDVSGTLGEIEKSDGTPLTYAELKAASPSVDLETLSILTQES